MNDGLSSRLGLLVATLSRRENFLIHTFRYKYQYQQHVKEQVDDVYE